MLGSNSLASRFFMSLALAFFLLGILCAPHEARADTGFGETCTNNCKSSCSDPYSSQCQKCLWDCYYDCCAPLCPDCAMNPSSQA